MDGIRTQFTKPPVDSILARARREARREETFDRGGFHYCVVWDHILESQCSHNEEEAGKDCSKCLFSQLQLPELPEMVFPRNKLVIAFSNFPNCYIECNALDSLKMVCHDQLPDVQVAPSAVWQESRKQMNLRDASHPFDWTFTTKYAGTLHGCEAIPTSQTIDMERLKRQETIGFYSQVTLFEDELADHGSATLSVRIRVMPKFFFVLMRFYLRIDRVLVRVCDTRFVGDNGSNSILREWSRREAKVEDIKHLGPEELLNADIVWASLPVIESRIEQIRPACRIDQSTD